MVPHDTGSPPDRAARGGYSSIPTRLGSRQIEPPRRETPCPQATLSYRRFPAVGSVIAPARGVYSSIPTHVGSRQSEPPRRATPSCPFWRLATLWDLVFLPPDQSSRTPVGATAPSRPMWVRDNRSHPAVRRRAVHLALLRRVDDSSFLFSLVILPFPGSIIAPPVGTTAQTRHHHASMSHPAVQRRVGPGREVGDPWCLDLACTFHSARSAAPQPEWKPPPTEETVLEDNPIAPLPHPKLVNWSSLPTPP
jgi:hypothetical protein